MRRCSFQIMGFAVLLATFPNSGHATTLTPGEFINEFLMETQVENADAVFVQFGADSSSPLNFTSNVDLSKNSFSFQLVPGSTYLGMPMTLSGAGTFNAVLNTVILSASATLGATAWTTDGVDTITSGDVVYTSETNFKREGVKIGDLTDACTVDEVKNTSDCFYTATDKDGGPIGAPFRGADPWIKVDDPKGGKDIRWNENIDGSEFNFVINSTGITPLAGGAGSFTTVISPVPEPSAFFLLGSSLAGILGFRFSRRN